MTNINHYIRTKFEAFQSTEKLELIQEFFIETNFSHFPVVEAGVFIGAISSNEAENLDANQTLSKYKYTLEPFFVRKNNNWLDVMEVFAKNDTTIVPILDENNQYIGYYEQEDIVKIMNETPFIIEQGASIVLQKNSTDFSISQISQIVESNNGKLLGIFISEATPSMIQATLKIGLGSVNELIQSFRRYEYDIISDHDEDNYWNNLKERSDYLDKYLNI